jgi:hypothetical protein
MVKFFKIFVATILAGFVVCASAEINVISVNDGTGSLVSIPIPGGNGLSVTVGTGTAAQPLQNLYNDPAATQVNIGDDANVQVPLQFAFPFFGQSFTNSWMHSNGVLSFQNPGTTGGFCCSGMDLSKLTDPRYNYAIMPLWTDLININGSQYYRTTETSATYGWYNVSDFNNTQSLNSFEVNITSSGAINTRLGGAMVNAGSLVTSGMTGNLAAGEYVQYYHGSGLQINSSNPVSWSAFDGTGSGNQCFVNPLFDPSCPGYQQAYYNQQCSINALYDSGCPGYQQAYFNQQCSINPLYNSGCPGYQQAYFNQQCSINALYDTGCAGYQQAYFNQQCSINGLYSRDCSNYAEAYAAKNIINKPEEPPTVAQVQTVPDPVTSSITPTQTTSTTSPTSVTSVVAPKTDAAPAATTAAKTDSKTETKSETKSESRQPQSQAQREKAKKEATEAAKNLATAKSLEAQQAAQSSIVAGMGIIAGFDVYEASRLPDVIFYRQREIYANQQPVDNRNSQRFLSGASDALHQRMIEQQYQIGK